MLWPYVPWQCVPLPQLILPVLLWGALLVPALLAQIAALASLPAERRRAWYGRASLAVVGIALLAAVVTVAGIVWIHALQAYERAHCDVNITVQEGVAVQQADAQATFLSQLLPILAVAVLALSAVTAATLLVASRHAERHVTLASTSL